MKHIWSILCQTSIRDQDTNRTSIINALDSIGFIVNKEKLEKQKNIPTNLEIVSLWSSDKKEIKDFSIRIDLLNSNKEILLVLEMNVPKPNTFPADRERRSVTTRMSINNLPITIAGGYLFKVSLKGSNDKNFNIVAQLPLDVKIKYQDKVSTCK